MARWFNEDWGRKKEHGTYKVQTLGFISEQVVQRDILVSVICALKGDGISNANCNGTTAKRVVRFWILDPKRSPLLGERQTIKKRWGKELVTAVFGI